MGTSVELERVMDQQDKDTKAVADAAAAAAAGANGAGGATEPIRVGGKEYASWEEVGKAYESLQSEYGKAAQQFGDLRKQYEDAYGTAQKWSDWWKNVQPLWGEDVERLLQQKMRGGKAAAADTPGTDQVAGKWAGYDLLRPEEQAERLRTEIASQLQTEYDQKLVALAQAMNQSLTQKEQYYNAYLSNYLGLMRRAFDERQKNPEFNVEQVLEAATKALSGNVDPLELGRQLVDSASFEARLKAAKKEAYEQGKKDFEQEAKNKKQEVVPPTVGAPKFQYSLPPQGSRHSLGQMKQKVAEQLVQRFGPDLFTG